MLGLRLTVLEVIAAEVQATIFELEYVKVEDVRLFITVPLTLTVFVVAPVAAHEIVDEVGALDKAIMRTVMV